jgi:glycerophosphoryl diester phosphodiesterase
MRKLIYAHRGVRDAAPENSLAAFQKAIDIGCDGVELDVRKTKDNVLVVVHDPDFHSKFIRSLNFGELSELSNNQIPALKEVLDLCLGKISLNVELKEGGYEKQVGQMLLDNFGTSRLIVTSFSAETLIRLKDHYPQIKTGLIVGLAELAKILKLIFSGKFAGQFDGLSLDYRFWQNGLNKFFPLRNHRVWSWTADNPEMISRLLREPRISGIITNRPGLAISIAGQIMNAK